MIDKKERTKLKREIKGEMVDDVCSAFRPIIQQQNKIVSNLRGDFLRLERKVEATKTCIIYPDKNGKYICPVCDTEVNK